jgi:hypothetical protein
MKTLAALLVLVVFSLTPGIVSAQQMAEKHPGYLHALSDLRTARWMLSHQAGDAKVYAGEEAAVSEIDAAMAEIRKASIDDGKNLNDHPNTDVKDHGSRLLRAMELIKQSHDDISGEEDNPGVSVMRRQALEHIRKAQDATVRAHAAWLKENGK